MIIWGTRGITSTQESNHFHCPQCQSKQMGDLKQVRVFFTLYFIPLIPMHVHGRYVECTSCGGTFHEDIFTYDPEQARREMFDQMLRVMILAALADGEVDYSEHQEIKRQYMDMTGFPPTEAKLEQEIQLAREAGTTLSAYLEAIKSQLSSQGQALVIRLAYHTMSAGGPMNAEQLGELYNLGMTLGLSNEQYREYLEHLRSEKDEELV